MSRTTTIVLSIVNAALFAFIMIYERDTFSTTETAGRRGQVLATFLRDQLERVELVRGDEPPIVLVHSPPSEDLEEGELDLGSWSVAAPIEAEADEDAVDELLGALEWLSPARTLTDISDDDRERFGLTHPRFVVRFTVRGQTSELSVGGEAPTGEGIYVAVAGEPNAHVVEASLTEQLDHDVDHFRSKDLLRDFFASDAQRLELEDGEGPPIVLARDGEVWQLEDEARGWASAGIVDGLLRALRQLRATRFIADEVDDLGQYGLDDPWRRLTASRAEDASGRREATLAIGAACGEHEGERYARVDEGPIVCVADDDVSDLEVDRASLREERLLPITDDAIERIELTVGDRELELRREEAEWRVIVGGDEDGERADEEAVAQWTGALREARALAFEPIEGEAGHATSAPRARLTIHRSDRESSTTFRLGERVASGPDAGVWVRRGDENAVTRFALDVDALFDVRAIRFADRQVIDATASEVSRIQIREGTSEQRAIREGAEWRLEAPIEAEADRVVIGELTRRFCSLEAARFEAEEARPEHGLASPSARVEVELSPAEGEARTIALELGGATVDGRYARVAGRPAVFVLENATVDALLTSLVSRDLVAMDVSSLRAIRIERGAETFALTREGDGFVLAGGAADPDRVRSLVDRLGTIRASGVIEIGPPTRELATRVVGTLSEGGEVTLTIGEPEGEGDDAYVPLRSSAVGVTYRARPDAVAPIVGFHP